MRWCVSIVDIFFVVITLGVIQVHTCDILKDPGCRVTYPFDQHPSRTPQHRPTHCQYHNLWLLPGRADSSCTRPGAKRLIEIDPKEVSVRPEIIKLPGCFTVEIKNVHIMDKIEVLGNSLFAKIDYQWWNVKGFSELKCQNASTNGCGGYGNHCYYCDICESLSDLDASPRRSTIAEQFRGINCPKRPGYYTFRKEFCFNDWTAFDANGDCKLDIFENDDISEYQNAFASLQQIGYGTVLAKLKLAFNATGEIERRRKTKEAQIEETIGKELEEKRRTWDVSNGQFDRFKEWYIQYRKDIWHRDDYLPWLLYENEIACLRLTFDVCQRKPQRSEFGMRYTCDSN